MKKILIILLACATMIGNTSIYALENENQEVTTSTNISIKETINIKSKLTVKATAYAGDTITSTGTTPKWGTLAVDPKVIPYGSKIYIPQFDMIFIAEDCGGDIKGNRLDIFMDTEDNCNKWGVQNIDIMIIE